MIAVLGSSGRIGSELVRLATERGLPLGEVEAAAVVLLALPTAVARGRIDALEGRTVIDLSGAAKRDELGPYGLRVEEPSRGVVYGNPGCIAGAAICAVLDGRVEVEGPLHITAVGGASTAHRDQSGTVRVARRWRTHPHVAEIEAALGVPVASFVPMVAYGHERGLVVSVSGRGRAASSGTAFDVADVVGTSELRLRVEADERGFTAVAGIDNLTWPASQAIRLAERLL